MRKMPWLYSIAVLFSLTALLVYLLYPAGSKFLLWFGDLAPIIVNLAAVVVFILVYQVRVRRDDPDRKPWLFLTLGFSLYLLGEISWAIYELVLNVKTPYPSLGDLFWLAGYIPLFIGMALALTQIRPPLNREDGFFMALTAIMLLVIVAVILFRPLLTGTKASPLAQFLDLAYPAGNVFLLVPALGMIFALQRRHGAIPWLLIMGGLVLISLADLIFSYLNLLDLYESGYFVDLGWIWGYLLIALGGFNEHFILTGYTKYLPPPEE